MADPYATRFQDESRIAGCRRSKRTRQNSSTAVGAEAFRTALRTEIGGGNVGAAVNIHAERRGWGVLRLSTAATKSMSVMIGVTQLVVALGVAGRARWRGR